MVFHFLSISLLFLFADLSLSDKQDSNSKFKECGRNFSCGTLNFSYPFWSSTSNRPMYCGFDKFNLSCVEEEVDDLPIIHISSREFKILEVEENIIRLVHRYYQPHQCPENTTFMPSVFFKYPKTVENLTLLYDCPNSRHSRPAAMSWCQTTNGNSSSVFYEGDDVEGCVKAQVQVDKDVLGEVLNRTMQLNDALLRGFDVQYIAYNQYCTDCKNSGGVCGSDENEREEFRCFCPANKYRHDSLECSTTGVLQARIKVLIGGLTGLGGLILVFIYLFIYIRKYIRKQAILSRNNKNIEEFLTPHRYTYAQLKKMTNSFSDMVGRGGFGTVYKGKLPDGDLVAVKVLKESNSDGQDFINEVVSMSRTSHVNVVKLVGFCYENTKRCIIFEYVSNGSLADFVSTQDLMNLQYKAFYDIAVGIARGLEYLHRGCNTRIIHFDIKPQNILLDEDLCPKISDFGLAKLMKKRESMLSMVDARGTVGYVAPEVFNRNYGGASYKSDVYSYGMLVLEMLGARRNDYKAEVFASNTGTTMYFPDWIYKDLERENNLKFLIDDSIGEEQETARKMIVVSLWCIQTDPLDRPSMSKVVEMLEGNLEALEIPPKPFLYSPARSAQESSYGTYSSLNSTYQTKNSSSRLSTLETKL